MKISEFLSLCHDNSIDCREDEARILMDFSQYLLSENEKYNLTAITSERAFMLRHLCDSLTILPYVKSGSQVLDIGCGGGFPSVPLAVCRSDVSVTALDSTSKKIAFVSSAASHLMINNLSTISARAEELAHNCEYREKFDIVTARAVSRLSVLCELAAAYLKSNGILIAMKGDPASTSDELKSCAEIARCVGLSHYRTVTFNLRDSKSDEELSRTIVIMKKIGSTPASYPRKYQQIIKNK